MAAPATKVASRTFQVASRRADAASKPQGTYINASPAPGQLARLSLDLAAVLVDGALGARRQAAPQIGITQRIIVFRNKVFDDKSTWTKSAEDYDVLINPRITQARGDLVYMAEGCLSCPEIQVDVGRFPEIKVRAADIKGRKINIRYTDF